MSNALNTVTGTVQRVIYSPAFLFFSAAVCFWLGLGWVPLFDLDEGAFTEATREMLESGIYSATYLDGEPRYDKPIFFYWIQALTISLFGYNEWAFRLPSVIAASLWAWALHSFVRGQFNLHRAHIATLFMITCLWVALIARSAIADALLNLFLSLTLFDIWRRIQTGEAKYAYRLYLWMALGTLTKGPVAVVVPLAVSLLYLLSRRELLAHYRTYFNPIGWIIYFGVVSPWVIAVSLEQGSGFFEGFILEHNLQRFSDTRENHGGSKFYYFAALPLILLPLSGLLGPLVSRSKQLIATPLDRFLLIWFAVIFVIFSFSKTQLPHYILNACVPLFILLATRVKLRSRHRWTTFFGLGFATLLLLVPEILTLASEQSKGYDGAMISRYQEALPDNYRMWAAGLWLIALALVIVPAVRTWQRLILMGLCINAFVFTVFVRTAWNVQQAPIHHMIHYLQQEHPNQDVMQYRMHMPTFSVYRQRITPLRAPGAGELALVRVDRVEKLEKEVQPLQVETLHRSGGLLLVRVAAPEEIERPEE